jgi:hypothetical protein
MTAPKVAARAGGSLYLLSSAFFIVAILLRSRVIKGGSASTAVNGIRASTFLFRVSLASELVSWALFLLAAMALYALLQHVSRQAAAAMVVFVVVLATVGCLSDLNLYTALTIATDANYAHTLGANESSALVRLFTDAQSGGLVVDQMFWGLWLIPLSYLVIKSRQFPQLLGFLLIIAAVNWLVQFAVGLLAPTLPYVSAIGQIGGLGELVFAAWLLVCGIRHPAVEAAESAGLP